MIPKSWSFRKGCFHCGEKLVTGRERFTRTCTSCAGKAREGFDEMAEGKFKKGMQKVLHTANLAKNPEEEAVVKQRLKKSFEKRKKKIIKKLKKKGYDQEQIAKHIKKYEEGFNED